MMYSGDYESYNSVIHDIAHLMYKKGQYPPGLNQTNTAAL